MAPITRKDKGADAILSPSNEVVKRVNTMNAPFSVQATGLDLPQHKDKYVPGGDASYDTIKANMSFYEGNRSGYVKSVGTSGVDPDFVLDTVTLAWREEGEEVTKVLTTQEVIDSKNLFFQKNTDS